MAKKTVLQVNNCDTADIPSLVELAIKQYNYPADMVTRYTIIVEEVLFGWQEKYQADSQVCLIRYDSKRNFTLEISIEGERQDPLMDNTSEDVLEGLVSRMKSGLGREIAYKYKDGRNIISLKLPKENVEKTLFNRNIMINSIPIIAQMMLLSIAGMLDSVMLSFYSSGALGGGCADCYLHHLIQQHSDCYQCGLHGHILKELGHQELRED